MLYASLTRNDRNPLKRFIQRKRIRDALTLTAHLENGAVLDFGAGDGELSRCLGQRSSRLRVCCYEPCGFLRSEASQNTSGLANVEIHESTAEFADDSFDFVFCLEVFEHLPETAAVEALGQLRRLLHPEGRAIIGVPIEIHIPAFVKGLFRMARRYGEYDARLWNILRATAGFPPDDRPMVPIDQNLEYHPHHLGFDHRGLLAMLNAANLQVLQTIASPCASLGQHLNSELHFLVRKAA